MKIYVLNKQYLKGIFSDWIKVFILLLDEAVLIAAFIFVLQYFNVEIPLVAVVFISIFLGVFILIIHVAVIPSFHRKVVTGSEGMIGKEGIVVKQLSPIGTIIVAGEYWRAKSNSGDIEVDEYVEITRVNALTLEVTHRNKPLNNT